MCLIATEDALSQAVVSKLVGKKIQELTFIRKGGFGYLKSSLVKFCDAARNGRKVFMLTDLDHKACAPALIEDWFGSEPIPSKFMFRVAVREVETWLMADRIAMANFLGISVAKIQRGIEDIENPKEHLLNLAKLGKRSLQKDLLPQKGAVSSQGFGYNARMIDFVSNHWSPVRAGELSQSLQRTLVRIETWS